MANCLTLTYTNDRAPNSRRPYNYAPASFPTGKVHDPVILLSSALPLDKPISLSERKIYKMSVEEHDILLGSLLNSTKIRTHLSRP